MAIREAWVEQNNGVVVRQLVGYERFSGVVAGQARHLRTRKDPFETVWHQVLLWLQENPEITAKELSKHLQCEYQGGFADGQLRTLQRRVREWRQVMARKLVYACMNERAK